MKIYFIRHTEADDDRRDSYGGIADDPLIESGKKYARNVGQVLSTRNIEVVYTSPYIRARETAELINEALSVEVVEIYNLRERNSYGVLSGIEKSRAKTLFPPIYMRVQQMKENDTKPSESVETLPGAETYTEILLRAKDAFNQIYRESKLANFKRVAVVTHGGFAWAFFKDVVKIPKQLEKGEIVVLEGNDIVSLTINEKETEELRK
ncbi:MAG: histidine phosphatase family protein [bacterium]